MSDCSAGEGVLHGRVLRRDAAANSSSSLSCHIENNAGSSSSAATNQPPTPELASLNHQNINDSEFEDDYLLSTPAKKWKEMNSIDRVKAVIFWQFPFFQWISNYTKWDLMGDFISGLTVGVLTIPKCLAYSKSAGLPQQYGLYSSWLCPVVYCLFGTSKHVKVGPTALLCLLISSQTNGDVNLTLAITMLSGLMQIACGYLRLGVLVEFVSHPVISGFASSAGFTIIAGQMKDILGGLKARSQFYYLVYDLLSQLPSTKKWDVTLGIICITYLLIVGRLNKIIKNPSSQRIKTIISLLSLSKNAVVCVVATLISYGMYKKGTTPWQIVGSIPVGLPSSVLGSPHLVDQLSKNAGSLVVGSVIIAAVSYLENIAIAQTYARQEGTLHTLDSNQELVALGWTNFIVSFVGSFPVTGSFSCTVVNHQAGVRTQLSGLLIMAIVLLAMFELTPAFYYIPNAVLASIVINAALSLIDFSVVKEIWALGPAGYGDLVTWTVSFFACLFFDIQYGMSAAIGVSIIIQLYHHARPTVNVVGLDLQSQSLLLHPTKGPSDLSRDLEVYSRKRDMYGADSAPDELNLLSPVDHRRQDSAAVDSLDYQSPHHRQSSSMIPSHDPHNHRNVIVFRVEGSIVFSAVSHIQARVRKLELDMRMAVKKHLISSPKMTSEASRSKSYMNRKPSALDEVKESHDPTHITIHLPDDEDDVRRHSVEMANIKVTTSPTSTPPNESATNTNNKKRSKVLHAIILDLSPVNYVDSSGLRALYEMYDEVIHRPSPLSVHFVGCRERIRDAITRFFVYLDPSMSNVKENFHYNVKDAIQSIYKNYENQSQSL